MKIRHKTRRSAFLIGLLGVVFIFCAAKTSASFPSVEQIQSIPVSDLYLLGRSDCRLDALEKQYYESLVNFEKSPEAVHLYHALKAKKEEIIFLRSRTDSLLFDLAFKDSIEKEKHINHCLHYNRFYKPAVQYKLKKISQDSLRSLSCFQYLAEVYRDLGSDSVIDSLCCNVYETILKTASEDNASGLHGDALLMMERMQFVFSGYSLPSRCFRKPYKEESILRRAHQGVYTSYYSVAEKAYIQKKERLAEKYARSALAYYQEKESYMNGVNPAKTLLKQIAAKYEHHLAYSQGGEAAVMKERIENIKKITGDTLSEAPLLSMNLGILPSEDKKEENTKEGLLRKPYHFTEKEVEEPIIVNSKQTHEEKKPAPSPLKKEEVTVHSSKRTLKKYDSKMAIHYKDLIYDGRLNMSIRRFEEAQKLFQEALGLEDAYRLDIDKELKSLLKENTYFYIEQILNNAQYFVWINRREKIQEEENKARQIYSIYKNIHQELSSSGIEFLFEDYQSAKALIVCRKIDEKRQNYASLAKYEALMGRYLKAYDYIDSARQLGLTNPCLSRDTNIEIMHQEYSCITSYYNDIRLSQNKLNEGDTTSYINIYLRLSEDRFQYPLKKANLRWVDLSDKLIYEKNHPILLFWLNMELQKGDCEQSLRLYKILKAMETKKISGLKKSVKRSRKLLKKCL